jgi:hypothetical protein
MKLWAATHPVNPAEFDDPDPQVAARLAERRELMRRAALTAIAHADAGRDMDPHHIAWAREFVRLNPPLGRPLGTGE